MKIKHYILFLLSAFLPLFAHAQNSSLWALSSSNLKPVVSAWGLLMPSLGGSGVRCIQVDNTGLFSVAGSGCSSGGGGGSDVNWTFFNGSGIYTSTTTNQVLIGASATTSRANLEVRFQSAANGSLLTTGSTTLQDFTSKNSTSTSATSTNFYTTNLGINSEYFFDLTGTGLSNAAGVLTNSGVISNSCSSGISCSGTNPSSFTNTGVTSIVAGLNVTISGATGAVTINSQTATTALDFYNSLFRDWSIVNGALSPTTTKGIVVAASSTISALTTVTSTSTSATTTNFAFTGLTSSLLAVNPTGQVIASSTIGNAQLQNSSVTVTTASPLGGAGTYNLGQTIPLTCTGCLTGNQTITLTGDVTGSGATSIVTSLSAGIVNRDWKLFSPTILQPTTTPMGILVNNSTSTITNLLMVNSTSTNATSTNLYVSSDFWLNAERFTDLTGTGLSNVAGVLTNSGVTSIVAGQNVAISGATGAVTVNSVAPTTTLDYYTSLFRDWSLQGSPIYLAPTTSRAIIINNGTSTITNLQVINGTTTNATSTNLYSTIASTTNLFGAGLPGAGCSGSNFLQWATGLFSCGTPAGGTGGGNSKWATSTNTSFLQPNGGVLMGAMFGTTTPNPYSVLNISTSTGQQIFLNDGSLTNSGWAFRAVGNTLYLSSTSPSTYATSSIPAITIQAGNSYSFGTSTPNASSTVEAYSNATTTLMLDSNHPSKGSCIALKDMDGTGYTYVYGNNGSLVASTVSCY